MDDNEQQKNDQEVDQVAKMVGQGSKQVAKDLARIATKQLRTKIKVAVTEALLPVILVIIKVVLVVLLVAIVLDLLEYTKEKMEALFSPQIFENALDLKNEDGEKLSVTSLVTIVKDEKGETYHLEFTEEAKEKIEKAADKVGKKYSNLRDPELWKKFIMANIATQFPDLGGTGKSVYHGTGDGYYWWPVGGSEVTEENGIQFAKGEPTSTNIWWNPGWRNWNGGQEWHKGTDIGYGNGHDYIISIGDGEVVNTSSSFNLGNWDSGANGRLSGYGNSVMVKYAEDLYVVYGHMKAGTVNLNIGDKVYRGQVLGVMGDSGYASGVHCCFVMLNKNEFSQASTITDISPYVSPTNPRPTGSVSKISNLDGFLFIGDSITYGLESSNTIKANNVIFRRNIKFDSKKLVGKYNSKYWWIYI